MFTNLKIGLGISGSFCTTQDIKKVAKQLVDTNATVYPILSNNIATIDTRFGKASELITYLEDITGNKVITELEKAEHFGPYIPLDVMVLFPLTSTSLNKLAIGISDTAPLLSAKATLRQNKPVVIGLFTNDALGASGQNIMKLMNTKNMFFVPFGQDDYIKKPNSMVAKTEKVIETVQKALNHEQIQPVIIENFHNEI